MLLKITNLLMTAFFCCASLVLSASDANMDEAVFHIECPDDVTVSCDAEIWDLTGYGWAYVYGYGNPVPANNPVVSYHLNSCGSGHVKRTWTAYDYQNNPHTCSQYIYVGGGGFGVHNIDWPPNYMTKDCYGSLEPDDLPAPFDYPTYDAVNCSQIMIGYDDLVFDFGGGCKKILRTWSLLDWCTYNPNYPHGGGRWDYTQVLKVKPDGGLNLTCPDDITANAGPNCSGTYVSIPSVSGTGACGSSVQVTNNSPYSSSNGSDASGLYPYGETWITFTAEDACGNWETCKVKVVVKDMKKPTPICYNGLTANLMMNSDGYYIDLDPKWFNKGSFDNCTPKHLLKYRLEPSHFTCDTRGRQDVRMYVIDQDGNEQYCNTYVIIQDNMGMCPPIDTTTFTLSGQITNVQGEAIQGIEIELMQNGDMMKQNESGASGTFDFNVLNSEDYMIIPRGDEEYALGLSTFDLLQLAKHVHGIKMLDADAELLAADADQNNDVNAQDLLLLRKLLLNHTTKLPNNKAWRFIPTDLLNNSLDPFQLVYEEYWQKENLDSDVSNIDFTAIKIGDINGSIQGLNSTQERHSPLRIEIEAIQNDNVISFVSKQALDIIGCQLELNIGSSTITNIIEGKFNCSIANTNIGENTTRLSWFLVEDEAHVQAEDVLFSIELKSDETLDLELLNNVLSPEIYSAGELIYKIELVSRRMHVEGNSINDETTITVFPNPAKFNQEIQVVSSDSEIEHVSVFNSQGIPVVNVLEVGASELSVPTHELKTGLYLIQVKTMDGVNKLERVIIE